MIGRVLTSDPVTRLSEFWHNESDGGVVLEGRQDVGPILEEAKRHRNARSGFKGDGMHHAGYIPLEVYNGWLRQKIEVTPELCAKWLDENPAFKTHPGRLSK